MFVTKAYVSRCGHCKNLAPVYDELAASFGSAADKVSIANVDADAHKDLGKRFGVQGFPTLKWFDGKPGSEPVDYNGGRDLESLQKFITEKSGVKPKAAKKAPSHVTILDEKSFKETVGSDKDVLVAFTAPWCGRESKLLDSLTTGANISRLQKLETNMGEIGRGFRC